MIIVEKSINLRVNIQNAVYHNWYQFITSCKSHDISKRKKICTKIIIFTIIKWWNISQRVTIHHISWCHLVSLQQCTTKFRIDVLILRQFLIQNHPIVHQYLNSNDIPRFLNAFLLSYPNHCWQRPKYLYHALTRWLFHQAYKFWRSYFMPLPDFRENISSNFQ